MHYILWIDVAWDVLIAVAFLGIAEALFSAVRSGKVGIVLGRGTFYSICLALCCAAVFCLSNAVSLAFGDNLIPRAIAKTLTGGVLLASCGIVNWRVYRVRHLPPEADGEFRQFEGALSTLREIHSDATESRFHRTRQTA